VIRQTYARFSDSLGREYQGEMHPEVSILILGPTPAFVVSYTPTTEPWRSRYQRIDVTFRYPPVGHPRAEAPPRFPTARSSAMGHLREGGRTEIVQPAEMCRIRTRQGQEQQRQEQCAYPRWNPRGLRYGIFDTITPDDDE
jgi:hypothetical protein